MLENFKPSDIQPSVESTKDNSFKMPEVKDLPPIDDKEEVKDINPMLAIDDLPPVDDKCYANGEPKENNEKNISCRNEKLKDTTHPETNVPFKEKTVENAQGEQVTGVFPEFESTFDALLPEEMYQSSDKVQFDECNKQLKEAVENNSELKEKFSDEQLEQIENRDTPDGYTWHHHEESGKMQLVDTETHSKTGHTGGKAIWGGGSENR